MTDYVSVLEHCPHEPHTLCAVCGARIHYDRHWCISCQEAFRLKKALREASYAEGNRKERWKAEEAKRIRKQRYGETQRQNYAHDYRVAVELEEFHKKAEQTPQRLLPLYGNGLSLEEGALTLFRVEEVEI